MWRPILILPLLLAAAPPPAEPATPGEQSLAFAEADERMTVPVMIEDGQGVARGPYHFIVDTGSQRTVIAEELAAALGLPPGPAVQLTGMTGTRPAATVVIPALSVAQIRGQRIEAPAVPMKYLGASGLLGIDTLQERRVTVDFVHRTMTVAPAVRVKRSAAAENGEIVVKARAVLGQLTVTDAYYQGRRIQVIVDTGSMATLGNPALRALIGRSQQIVHPVQVSGVTGETMPADYGEVGEIEIANVTVANLPVAFAEAEPFRHFNLRKRPALMLGMDALKTFRRVTIDFANREIRLQVEAAAPQR